MKAGWERKRLSEVCTLQRGFDLPTKDREPGNVPLVSSSGVVDRINQRKVRGPGVVTGRSGSIGNVFFVETDFWPLNTALYVKDFFGNDERFIYLLLQSLDLARFASGAGVPTLNRNHLSDTMVFIPNRIDEQRRIVAVLDEAFAAIATATANTVKKVGSVRLFMDHYLRNRFCSIDAKAVVLGDLVSFRNGLNFSGASKGETIRIVGVKDFQNNLHIPDDGLATVQIDGQLLDNDILREGDILTVRSNGNKALIGRCMIAGQQSERTSHSGFTIRIRPDRNAIDPQFLCRVLKSPDIRDRLVEGGGGANISSLNQKALASLPIPIPTPEAQRRVVSELDDMAELAARLFEVADKKLSALAALRQSLLESAFAGELVAAPVLPSEGTRSQFATPQFTAQIIALAHYRHERQQSQRTFGHVKAQKALQLAESIGGIDLGRCPIKDAAGPNDFQHMLRATDWATQNDFFEFVPRASGNGYDFKKLANFSSMMTDTLAATRPVSAALERAIDPIVPMVSQDAEVFATVHAAWNNLLHDGKVASDDAIVKEARDDWHSAKLKIPEAKFRTAIKSIRAKGLTPDGTAKYVGGQGGLF